jgi:endonuclease I
MIKRFLSISLFLALTIATFAQIPAGYYTPADGKTGAALKTALYNIINGHTTITYGELYNAYQTTDSIIIGGSNKVYDMYSIRADRSANYYYTQLNKQCGNYSSEGDCYNREHSMPQSWFNSLSPMVSDLYHVYPTDGKVNGMRSNYPFGKVSSPTYTSTNGSKLGSSDAATGYTGIVFEPIDEYKGDFARTYFYMATRYENVISTWASNGSAGEILDGTSYPAFKTWYKELMLLWNQIDPVSPKEIARNNAVYAIQHNRNPFIDHPEFADAVWGNGTATINFTSTPITSVTVGQVYTYSVSVAGPAGSTLVITAPTKPAWLTLTTGSAGHATLIGTPSATGPYDVVLSLTDGTNTKTQSFTIQVAALEGLKFTSTPSLTGTVGSAYSYSITTSDNANPAATISITATKKPSWLTLASTGNGTATLSGTPLSADAGDNAITLSANDGITSVEQSFTITIGLSGVTMTETFENMPAATSTYSNISWTGNNSIVWTATLARTDLNINTRAVCFKKATGTYLYSAPISGGCSQVSFKHQQMYSTVGGEISLYINDQLIGSPVAVTAAIQTAQFNGFSITGDVTIKLVSNGVTQIGIDDVSWIGASSTPNVLPSVTNIANSPVEPSTGQPITVSATITDSDGTIQEAYISWGTSSGNLTSNVIMTLNAGSFEGTIPAQSQAGIVFFTVSGKDNSGGITTSTQSSILVTAANILPSITNISNSPQNPIIGQDIVLTAAITDSDGSIQDAWVDWGTSASNLNNQVQLTFDGTAFSATIPAQAQAGTVYLSLNARDDLDGVTTVLSSFTVSVPNVSPTITNIIIDPIAPITGQSITVSATLSDSDGTIQEASLNWGTSLGAQSNLVSMALNGGHYEGVIPAQSQAGTIYFTLNAKDNSNAVSNVESNFTVAPATFIGVETTNSSLRVYPNPAKYTINIELSGVHSDHLTISNIIGEKIIDMPFNGTKQSVDIRKMIPGIYFVIVTGKDFKETVKVIVF